MNKSCKDCLHYEVCNYHICEETDMTVAECPKFTDRSEWVHLPCIQKKNWRKRNEQR